MKIKTMCGSVRLTDGDFANEVSKKCDEVLAKIKGKYLGTEITRISGVSEVTLLLITVFYEEN